MENKNTNVSLKDVEGYIDEVFQTKDLINQHSDCELCNLSKKTKWYYEDEKWVICECKTCHRPMVVYKKHTMFIPFRDWFAIHGEIIRLFGSEVTLRFKQRKIKNHFHIHIYNLK